MEEVLEVVMEEVLEVATEVNSALEFHFDKFRNV